MDKGESSFVGQRRTFYLVSIKKIVFSFKSQREAAENWDGVAAHVAALEFSVPHVYFLMDW